MKPEVDHRLTRGFSPVLFKTQVFGHTFLPPWKNSQWVMHYRSQLWLKDEFAWNNVFPSSTSTYINCQLKIAWVVVGVCFPLTCKSKCRYCILYSTVHTLYDVPVASLKIFCPLHHRPYMHKKRLPCILSCQYFSVLCMPLCRHKGVFIATFQKIYLFSLLASPQRVF